MVVITGAASGAGSQTSVRDGGSRDVRSNDAADAPSGALRLEPTTHPLATFALNRNATPNGAIDEVLSLNDMLDSCIMYYYAVAHKYIVMVSASRLRFRSTISKSRRPSQIADLRDNIGLLSDVLLESKETFSSIKRNVAGKDNSGSASQQEEVILNELNSKFTNRTQVFMVRKTG